MMSVGRRIVEGDVKKKREKCEVRIEPRISNSRFQAYRLQARDAT
jgi:hypothetical protein